MQKGFKKLGKRYDGKAVLKKGNSGQIELWHAGEVKLPKTGLQREHIKLLHPYLSDLGCCRAVSHLHEEGRAEERGVQPQRAALAAHTALGAKRRALCCSAHPTSSRNPDMVPLTQAEADGVTAHHTGCASHPSMGQPSVLCGSHSQADSFSDPGATLNPEHSGQGRPSLGLQGQTKGNAG